MPDLPQVGKTKHKQYLAAILRLEDKAQDLIDAILDPVIDRGEYEITQEQVARIGKLRRVLQRIRQEAHEARELIDNAPGEEKKMLEFRRAAGDGD